MAAVICSLNPLAEPGLDRGLAFGTIRCCQL